MKKCFTILQDDGFSFVSMFLLPKLLKQWAVSWSRSERSERSALKKNSRFSCFSKITQNIWNPLVAVETISGTKEEVMWQQHREDGATTNGTFNWDINHVVIVDDMSKKHEAWVIFLFKAKQNNMLNHLEGVQVLKCVWSHYSHVTTFITI